MRKKIAVHLRVAPEWGGGFQYAGVLLRALAAPPALGEIRCFYEDPGWPPLLDKLGLAGEPVRRPRGLSWLWNKCRKLLDSRHPEAYSKITLRLADWKPDLLISAQADSLCLPAGCRWLAPIHDLMHIHEPRFPEAGSPRQIQARNRGNSLMIEAGAFIMVDSKLGGEQVLANYPAARPEQLRVLPYAAPESLLRAEPRRPEGANLPEKFMFYPAQFWEHKNHVRLAEALAEARKSCPDLHGVFCGSAKYSGYEPFVRQVEELGLRDAVTVLGYVGESELAWLYRNARCLVMPTFFGPTNLPPLEAMALGCPAALSRVYAMPEQCGEAALYFNPESIPEMTEALLRLWRDDALRASLREKGLARRRDWNEEKMAARFREIVAEAAG